MGKLHFSLLKFGGMILTPNMKGKNTHLSWSLKKMTLSLMMPKIVSKSHSLHVLKTTPAKQQQRRPCKGYRCGIGQIPSESQVRELSQL